jgi:hypothetical protein
MNEVCLLIQALRLSNWILKPTHPSICCLWETHLNYGSKNGLKVPSIKYMHDSTNQKKVKESVLIPAFT